MVTPGRIELRLRRLDQLFESYDPAPFHEKDLDPDAEEFIVSWAREYPPSTPLVFVLHLPADQRPLQPQATVQQAVANYFTYRAGLARLELRRLLQQGRSSLLVGLLFLAVCTGVRQLVVQQFLQEGLLIVGWVAMWRPLELLLYDWWPIARRRRNFENLARMQVEVVFSDESR